MSTPRESSQSGLSTADMANAAARERNAATTTARESAMARTTQRQPDATTATTREAATAKTTAREPHASTAATMSDAQPVQRHTLDRGESQHAPLFAGREAEKFRSRWSDIQTSFVDEPRRAVEEADGLVAEVMQRLAQVFADERRWLEQQWDRGEQTNTEELRQALQRYRSFFDRLLSM